VNRTDAIGAARNVRNRAPAQSQSAYQLIPQGFQIAQLLADGTTAKPWPCCCFSVPRRSSTTCETRTISSTSTDAQLGGA
jgi:hypothetical protein